MTLSEADVHLFHMTRQLPRATLTTLKVPRELSGNARIPISAAKGSSLSVNSLPHASSSKTVITIPVPLPVTQTAGPSSNPHQAKKARRDKDPAQLNSKRRRVASGDESTREVNNAGKSTPGVTDPVKATSKVKVNSKARRPQQVIIPPARGDSEEVDELASSYIASSPRSPCIASSSHPDRTHTPDFDINAYPPSTRTAHPLSSQMSISSSPTPESGWGSPSKPKRTNSSDSSSDIDIITTTTIDPSLLLPPIKKRQSLLGRILGTPVTSQGDNVRVQKGSVGVSGLGGLGARLWPTWVTETPK
jgi:hypothetical protein